MPIRHRRQPVLVPADLSSSFSLGYDENHQLVDFGYTAGSAGSDPSTIKEVAGAFRAELARSEVDHVDIRPLPPSLLESVVEDILNLGESLFHTAPLLRSWLVVGLVTRSDSRRSILVYWNQSEASDILNVRDFDKAKRTIADSTTGVVFVTDPRGVSYCADGIGIERAWHVSTSRNRLERAMPSLAV